MGRFHRNGLKTVGDNISNVGTKLLPGTAGVMGLGTAAVKTAADFDSAMSKVAEVSGATGKDLDTLRDKAREMGSKMKFSASEAAEAMNYMAMAGWKTEDMLSSIEGVMNHAAASLSRRDELEHAYEKFQFGGGTEKPDFETVYEAV